MKHLIYDQKLLNGVKSLNFILLILFNGTDVRLSWVFNFLYSHCEAINYLERLIR